MHTACYDAYSMSVVQCRGTEATATKWFNCCGHKMQTRKMCPEGDQFIEAVFSFRRTMWKEF